MFGPYPHTDVDALAGQDLSHDLARLGLLEGQQPVERLHDGGAHTEAGDGLAQLRADGAASEDHHRRRQLLGLHGLAIGPIRDVRQPWDGRDGGTSSGGHHDGTGRPRSRGRQRPPSTAPRFDPRLG
ncbi:MAG TPA: hypothetical protein VK988_04875 [Acidimicrobiales bacterium]|nr:hypothetical protein [Acidimicrobiales bacterium]